MTGNPRARRIQRFVDPEPALRDIYEKAIADLEAKRAVATTADEVSQIEHEMRLARRHYKSGWTRWAANW